MEFEYFDCHCHLDHERFVIDFDDIINRSYKKHVGIIHSGTDKVSNKVALDLRRKYGVFCTFGVYPMLSIDEVRDFDDEFAFIREHADECVGIGECGMDFKGNKDNEDLIALQRKYFSDVISLSTELDKPLVIHSRSAEDQCIELMREAGCRRVLMHCFHGKKSLIREVVRLGWTISVPSNITRLDHFRMVVEMVPLTQLVTETDGPFLAKELGGRSEPIDVIGTVDIIAEIKGLSIEEVRSQLRENVLLLFGI